MSTVISAKVIADSVSPNGIRLTTLECTYPRSIHSEIMTHRTFARNTASSRAIPVEKTLARVRTDPFVPLYWGKNQKGMQAHTELTQPEIDLSLAVWLEARDAAVMHTERLSALGLHKQLVNRLLEPFLWHVAIITATEWDNFFHLRDHPDAEPHLQILAKAMRTARNASVPATLDYGQWHLPYIQPDDVGVINDGDLPLVSAARCARVSYLTHDGKRDHIEDLNLYTRLLSGGHLSPLEHTATPMTAYGFNGNLFGWTSLRKTIPNEHDIFGHPEVTR